MKNKKLFFLLGFIFLITLPYLVAGMAQGGQLVFGGFLLNPLDGNSYLAKMMEGWSGKWTFELPYTAQKGSGVYLFLFYIALGHLARTLSLPVLIVFHITRILASIFLFSAIDQLINVLFPESENIKEKALLLCLTGAGLGWLVIFTGYIPTDFWVAELFPFLSSYSNPHFPLGLALICWLFIFSRKEGKKFGDNFLLCGMSLALAIVLPFGVIIVLSALTMYMILGFSLKKKLVFYETYMVILGGVPMLIYQYWVTLTDPILAQWNAQNITLTPPVWDLILACAPAIFLAVWYIIKNWQTALENDFIRLIIAWLFSSVILFCIPFNLQRRFLTGLYIPISLLAIFGITSIGNRENKGHKWIWRSFYLTSTISNIIILFLAVFAISSKQPSIYISKNDMAAFDWMQANLPAEAIILASPETGLRIPAYTDLKVVYGHPYETINAESMKASVISFYESTSKEQSNAYIHNNNVKFIFWGEQEQKYGKMEWLKQLPEIYQSGPTIIFLADNY